MAALFHYLGVLAAGILVGKVVLFSFVVAPVLARTLDPHDFGKVVRRLFPSYYALGMGVAASGAASAMAVALQGRNPAQGAVIVLWMFVFAAEFYCRSWVTPRSNAMKDQLKEQESLGPVDPALQAAWNRLHQRSVYLNSAVLLAGASLLVVTV